MNFARPILFEQLMEPVAARLLGEPNQKLSKPPKDVRFGTHGSMSIDYVGGRFFDHERGVGGGVIDLIKHALDCDHNAAVSWLKRERILEVSPSPKAALKAVGNGSGNTISENARSVEATYDYHDESGALLFQVVRYSAGTEPRFRQRRPGNSPSEWIWKLDNIRRVLYRLPEVATAVESGKLLFVVEGEKDAENLRALGLAATTNPGGAGKWWPEYSEYLRNADVVVVGDNDDPGRAHVKQVVAFLRGVVKRVRVIELANIWPECPHKGDISDWIAAGGTAEKLLAFIEAPPGSGDPERDNSQAVIQQLAALSPLDYQRQRLNAAENLDVRASELDKLVRSAKAEADEAKSALPHWNVEPWTAEVAGAKLLEDIERVFRRYNLTIPRARLADQALRQDQCADCPLLPDAAFRTGE